MAEDDAEQAFLKSQAMSGDANEYTAVDTQLGNSSDSEDYDPSETLHDEYSVRVTDSKESEIVPSISAPPDQPTSSHFLSPGHPESGELHASYPSQTPSRAESRASTSGSTSAPSKARTIGGFVIDEEEEDNENGDDQGDAEYEPPAVLGEEGEKNTPVSMFQAPAPGNANQATSTLHVPVHGVEQTPEISDDASIHPRAASATLSKDAASSVPDRESYAAQPPQPALDSGNRGPALKSVEESTPNSRLPHDRVGILEDRIREDPRGDISAWLELIDEHRNRNRLDAARDAFERFLKIFPAAVSSDLHVPFGHDGMI